MGSVHLLLTILLILASVPVISGCFCDHYPWSLWSFCTKTCDQGTQQRFRAIVRDEHWEKNNCENLCKKEETKDCNVEKCPISCQLTEFEPWSKCLPCVDKQFRTKSLMTAAQFGGLDCTDPLMDQRPCHPSKQCKIESVNCKDKFKCNSGRCINAVLHCNGQNDCLDNSDEKDCPEINPVCATQRFFHPPPGVDVIGLGYDLIGEQTRGAVLENSILGEECNLNRSTANRKIYRLPANIESYNIKVEKLEDIQVNPPVTTEMVPTTGQNSISSQDSNQGANIDIPIFFKLLKKSNLDQSFKEEMSALQKKDSKYFRVSQVIATARFRTKPSDLYLSDPFLEFLNGLPLEYSYALYRQIFQKFGTHYFSAGTLGGKYELMFQYDREELTTQGFSEENVNNCIHNEFSLNVILYSTSSSSRTCGNKNTKTEFKGSMMKMSEKCISTVIGGRSEYAAALAFERSKVLPDSVTYKDWVKSTIDNPSVIDYELRPLVDLVRGFPCALTKRQHMRQALNEYLAKVDSCKCAPCPNNGRAALSETECVCICQSGTYGTNCEKRAKDFILDAVDGYWSCWSSWSQCTQDKLLLRRSRTRSCNNPAPQGRGKPCQGPNRQEEQCTISIFQKEGVCMNDDDFETEGDREDTLPPGVTGCSKPKSPPNSYLRLNRRVYVYGGYDDFVCFTGFELNGFQRIYCKQDGTWEETKGSCIRKVCSKPKLPADIKINPTKDDYQVGSVVSLSCSAGTSPSGPRYYTCDSSLTWEPNIAPDIHCRIDVPFIPDKTCPMGQRRDGSQCVCIPRGDCAKYKEDFCIFDVAKDRAVMMSFCALHAGRCHGDKLYYMNDGQCVQGGASLDWARFRARIADQSAVQVPCGSDICYDWETCSALEKCLCIPPRDCPKDTQNIYCLSVRKRQRNMPLCNMAAQRCGNADVEIVHEGECTDA